MIFQFSATGNSKYIANKVQKRFGGDIYDIKEEIHREKIEYSLAEGEIVFLVFPTFYFNPPKPVDEFISKVEFSGIKRENVEICAITTCGTYTFACDRMLRRTLSKRGMKLRAFYQVKMPESYIMLFKIPLPEEQVMIIRRADKTINDVCDAIEFNYRVLHESSLINMPVSMFGHFIYRNKRPTKKFYVTDKCVSCGLCEKVCSDGIIKISDKGIPEWTEDRCSHCSACINRCPENAIEYGKKTKNRVRYVNPYE